MESEIIKIALPYIKYSCWAIVIGGLGYVAYRRLRTKLVTLDDIINCANEHKSLGTDMFVNKFSALPENIRKKFRKELGMQFILNGYREDSSVIATIMDADDHEVKNIFFMGDKMDEDLRLALGDKKMLNIKLGQ